jgi:hypothetical protein
MLTASVVIGSGPATAHDTCGQPTHALISTSPNVGTLAVGGPPLVVSTGITLYFTGVVHSGTVARFGLYDPVTQRRFFYSTHASRSNCVIHQEEEAIPASTIGVGSYEAWVIVIRWEDNPSHAETSILLGTLTVNQ